MPPQRRAPARRQRRARSARPLRPKPARTRAQQVALSAADPRFVEGVALFNHRRFFECHDVIEALWLQTHDRSKDCYKGLIHAAVAFYHWSKGNRAGALTLARSATTYLTRYAPTFHGLDLESFLAQFTELFRWLRRHRERYDPRLVPVMRWDKTKIATGVRARYNNKHFHA